MSFIHFHFICPIYFSPLPDSVRLSPIASHRQNTLLNNGKCKRCTALPFPSSSSSFTLSVSILDSFSPDDVRKMNGSEWTVTRFSILPSSPSVPPSQSPTSNSQSHNIISSLDRSHMLPMSNSPSDVLILFSLQTSTCPSIRVMHKSIALGKHVRKL